MEGFCFILVLNYFEIMYMFYIYKCKEIVIKLFDIVDI